MTLRLLAGIALFVATSNNVFAVDIEENNIDAFINKMVSEHDYDRATLENILGEAVFQEKIIEQISKPAERTLTWADYRPIFMTKERVNAGAEFWREHRESLQKVSNDTGVSVEMIVGIIGVETYYGRITGGHRVLDALTTLAFYYPPRQKFFRRELEQFLLLVREEDMQAEDAFGSYAGAMGRPQFMPSSYRAYAVDSTGDNKRDIWNNWTDVAGSIANYFVAHGWKSGEEITSQATLSERFEGPPPKNQLKADGSVASLSESGVVFSTSLANDAAAQLLTLEGKEGTEHWVGFHNFFVITKYNRSVMYGLAVFQLGQEIALEVAKDGS
ncbi:MAG: lytic murein transglycosylase B [Woeseiaceae bacterium]